MKTYTQTGQAEEFTLNRNVNDSERNAANREANSNAGCLEAFKTPNAGCMGCSQDLESLMFMANALWPTLDKPEVSEHLYVVFGLEVGGGLMISFDGFGADYGRVIVRSPMPQHIEMYVDTILQTLEGTISSEVAFSDMDKAAAWTSDFALRLGQLDRFWSEDEIFSAATERYKRKYGHSEC